MNATALRLLAVLALAAASLAGCGREMPSLRDLAGLPSNADPSVDIKAAENKWLLIKNPRFGDVASEPEYIWVEDDKVPTTVGTLIFGKDSLIAPPEIVAKYGAPPGGGRAEPVVGRTVFRAVDDPGLFVGFVGVASECGGGWR